ncbi:MAG: ferredoxin [Flavobacteriales bacterium]|nr:ferredoxin [Flavobacteriales bacterium]MCB9449253.1 ferredoxin [Flavobacteriales bacterium]
MIKVIHYRHKCIGCNACVEVDKQRWRISRTDGKSVLIGSIQKKNIYQVTTGDDEADKLRRAAEVCPVNIIKVIE